MILADKRYTRSDKKEKLPKWIMDELKPGNSSISVDQAEHFALRYFKDMA